MTEEHAWRGSAENNEDHLWLSVAEDTVVRAAWERAAAKRPEFDDMMRGIQQRTTRNGSQLPGDRMNSEGTREIDFSLKGLDSLRRKVATELRSEVGLKATEVVADLKDLNRYTLTFEPGAYTDGVRAAFQDLEQRGFESIKVQNTWTDPVYKGINSAWEHKESGQRIELQLHTPDSFRVKSENHKLFELERSGALREEFGKKKAQPYIDAANELMNDRYQQCRETGDQKLPIEVPQNHELLAKPFERAQLGPPASEEHKAAVRVRAGEPQPTAQQHSAPAGKQAAQQQLSVSQLAEMKGGPKNPVSAAAQARSSRGTAQAKGIGNSQPGQAPKNGPQIAQQARQQSQPRNQHGGGRGR
ncbi:hypothetical protein ACH4TX_12240 [Streptomyces sp. NPDC021098]|uniref:hypothetical protein n=1 Tax=unclassified Streptomyces TaxID=2593676 RepID=UPI0037A327F3